MKVLVVYAHPLGESFCEAVKNTAVNALEAKGNKVTVRDLYAMKFNPVLTAKDMEMMGEGNTPEDIKIEQELVSDSDGIIFIFPTWWENMPAIMRGYIDKVFALEYAYTYTENGPVGLLKGKKAMVFQTTGSPGEILESSGLTDAMKVDIGTGIFNFVGLENAGHSFLYAVGSVDEDSRKAMLKDVEEQVNKAF